MGQAWSICALDARQVLGSPRHLDEVLLNKEADALVDMLAIPTMPQIEGRDVANSRSASKMGQGLVQLITTARRQPQTHDEPCLTNLPIEVVGMVLRYLDILSCFRFALTSKYFWDIGWWHVHRAITYELGPWAGDRLICSGQYDTYEGRPVAVLSKDEEIELRDGLCEYDYDSKLEKKDFDSNGRYKTKPASLSDITYFRFDRSGSRDTLLGKFLGAALHETHHLPTSLRHQAIRFMRTYERFYP